jgi:E3 ubiquitin-protein ligase FANCL
MSLTKSSVIVGLRTSSIRRQHELPKVCNVFIISPFLVCNSALMKFPLHQKQDFVHDGKYPHVVHVEKPKSQDVDFSDAMIYQAKTTSEMEGMILTPSPSPHVIKLCSCVNLFK